MRPWRHLTPRYIYNRIQEKRYRRTHPNLPWLTPVANQILATYLKKTDCGLEFGSGRSTLWLASRVQHLTSVEHQRAWYEKVAAQLKAANLTQVDYYLHEKEAPDEAAQMHSDYVLVATAFADESLDFVLVDGIYRSACACQSLGKLRPGGMLILDNANWYLPCHSYAPNSRTVEQGPVSPLWQEFLQQVEDWRRIWTSNGVSDTAFFFKPCRSDKS